MSINIFGVKSAVEIWDAYDCNLKKIEGKQLVRGEIIPEGLFHIVSDILVKHVDGTYLLMQRDLNKSYGGMWEATAGGSALKGETPLQCAMRELCEETGIAATELAEVGRVVDNRTHSIYVEYLCITDCDKDSVILQQGETIAYKWVSCDELLGMYNKELLTERMQSFIDELKYNNAVACEVCGKLTFADDYGNTNKCSHCGWKSNGDSEFYEECYGISYPMLVTLSRAREQYKAGQKFKATFDEFINGLKFYAEMLFWHNGKVYEVFRKNGGAVFAGKEFEQSFTTIDEFRDKANINGKLLKDIWDEVVHPCFMYCAEKESDYNFPLED